MLKSAGNSKCECACNAIKSLRNNQVTVSDETQITIMDFNQMRRGHFYRDFVLKKSFITSAFNESAFIHIMALCYF